MGSAVGMVVLGLLALYVIISGKGLAVWQAITSGTATAAVSAAPTSGQGTGILQGGDNGGQK